MFESFGEKIIKNIW